MVGEAMEAVMGAAVMAAAEVEDSALVMEVSRVALAVLAGLFGRFCLAGLVL